MKSSKSDVSLGLLARARVALVGALVLVCFLGGGASRTDVLSLVYVLPTAALIGAALVAISPAIDLRSVRLPLSLLAALALLMLVQLVPLPPSVWTRLPGHAPFAQIAGAAGFSQPFRPISLTPDLTLASLADLVVPLAALLGVAVLTPGQRPKIVSFLLIGVLVSVILAIAQISTGQNSLLYTFEITNRGAAVGVFSNRNHQAVLLACSVPLLAAWLGFGRHGLSRSVSRSAFLFLVLLLLPLTLVTGSRAGLVLLGGAMIATIFTYRAELMPPPVSPRRAKLTLLVVALTCVLTVGSLAVLLSRAEALERLLSIDIGDENRLSNLGTLLAMAKAYFPVGSGFGSFDPLFRYFEPDSELHLFYLNHAHNDLVELLITGGLAGALILAVFLVWFCLRGIAILRTRSALPAHAGAQAGVIVMGIILLSSLVDYPLRTPLLDLIFALSAGLVSSERTSLAKMR